MEFSKIELTVHGMNIGTIHGWKCSFDVIHRMASYSMLPTNLGW
jgi:hypothetical protein